MRKLWFFVLPLAAIVIGILSTTNAHAAFNFFGRGPNETYYDGTISGGSGSRLFKDSPDIPYSGMTMNYLTDILTVDIFIDEFRKRLYSSTDYNSSRASAIINMMLGKNGNDPSFNGPSALRWQNGVAQAKANFATWKGIIRYYDSTGMVNFNDLYTDTDPWDWLGEYGPAFEIMPDIRNRQLAGVITNEPAIIFYNPDGTRFNILKKCVNLTGDTGGLFPPPPPAVVAQLLNGPPALPGSGTFLDPYGPVQSGTVYTIQPGAYRSSGPDPGNTKYTLTLPANVTVLNSGGGAIAGNTVTWYPVNFPALYGPVNAVTKNLSFTVNPTVTNGTKLRFTLRVEPDAWPAATSVELFYVTQNPRYPSVKGENSDIHAGGGPCGQLGSLGKIEGNATAGSGGQYVVSAVSSINNFNSNVTGDALKLGRNGGYSQVCRPDLVAAAIAYTGPNNGNLSGSVSLSGKAGVYLVNGNLGITQSFIQGKITLVNTGTWKITINGNITIDTSAPAYAKGDAPSLGIISADNIEISSVVTQVDAYIFTNRNVDTCFQGATVPTACNSTLKINGFLMAKSLSLRRSGPIRTAGAQIGELITLNPQIYLNPPVLFDASVDEIYLEGLGERAPLF